MSSESSEDVLNASTGDVLNVFVEDEASGATSHQLAVVCQPFNPSTRACWVNYIEPEDGGDGFYLDDVAYEVGVDSVEEHHRIDDSTAESLVESYRPLDLVPVANDADQGCRFERLGALEASCSDDEESEEESDSDCTPTLGGFIVPDDEATPFSQAPPDSEFVRDTHAAVRDFNAWQPTSAEDAQVKDYVADMAGRAEHANEDRRMECGLAPIVSYKNPSARR